ncbi:MAG: phosphoenolpyruvate carboxykinase (ATP) [candidate division Zixibacteria bacterium]|nr:phosphoenolpyruvate carboxykinase (ATP) [candidate division Zixibacteria bacterium]
MTTNKAISSYGLDNYGIRNINQAFWNLNTPMLYEQIIKRGEGNIAHLGPVVVRTGQHTGRAAKDKFMVEEPTSQKDVWWGKVNIPFSQENYDRLYNRLLAYLQGKDLFIQDCYAGADKKYQMPVRIINETAWHNLFARNMFIQADRETLKDHVPEFTVLHVPNFMAMPEMDGTNSEAFIIPHLGKKLVIIGGTSYAGETKKSIFTALNYLLPKKNVLSMHCSANVGGNGEAALFFGLSGTGKTTLSADQSRSLIGDDEHGWSPEGIFNFEGGCYAKVIKLSPEAEPEIYETTRKFGTILENVAMDVWTRRLDLDDDLLTENTRAAYPLSHIPNTLKPSKAGHPKNVIMLTCDAFGVMPPISRLSAEQAMYHFMSGYTAKLAGTEKGVTEPEATFSACFGAPFMVWHPYKYAKLLSEKIGKHDVKCWLVNTGWTGGPYGVGSRMKIAYTRAMVNAALDGKLDKVEYKKDPIFGCEVPQSCPDVPSEYLNQRGTWPDQKAYDEKAKQLAKMFIDNFKQFESEAPEEVKKAGPSVSGKTQMEKALA